MPPLVSRRRVLQSGTLAGLGLAAARPFDGPVLGSPGARRLDIRPLVGERRFRSDSVEATIERVRTMVAHDELGWLFANCFPATLDSCVVPGVDANGRPDTYVSTGDIDAMWLRDSSAQVWPYLTLVVQDPPLAALVVGVIRRQAACIRRDPYANAFQQDLDGGSAGANTFTDATQMAPGVHERKFELDSLCWPLRLAHGYWAATADDSWLDADWLTAFRAILDVMRAGQAGSDDVSGTSYRFARLTFRGTDTLALADGRPQPYRRCGLIASPFRPSDDAAQLAFHVPANAMAVVCLRQIADVLATHGPAAALRSEAIAIADEVDAALHEITVAQHPELGAILSYELDGFGSRVLMDDANTPNLISLAYLGYLPKTDALYQRTRSFALSQANPWFESGAAASGLGSAHVAPGWVWPIAIVMQALTADTDAEIVACLQSLVGTHAGTGFIHESFEADDPSQYTRSLFGWADASFAELLLSLARDRPELLATFR